MASQTKIFFTLLPFLISSLNPQSAKSEDAPALPAFAFSWPDDVDTFMAGDTATIKVIVLGNYESGKYDFRFEPNITVNDKMGNSSFISGISFYFDGTTDTWRIGFVPIMVGLFNVLITDVHFHVFDSSLHFHVNPGRMYPSAGIVLWSNGFNEFVAGEKAEIWILPKDAFGNNLSSTSEEPMLRNFTLFVSNSVDIPASLINVTEKGWNQQGYLSIAFVSVTAGSHLLHVRVENQTLACSPLTFKVNPGKLDVYSCTAKWNVETNLFQLFSMMEGFIHQHDQYGNLVSESHAFEIEVMEKGTNLSIPVTNLHFKDMQPGIQSFSFSLDEPGIFILIISDQENNTLISNMPYDFRVYIGYCDGTNSIVNGSGLNNSVTGETTGFSVFLKDAYKYPSPVELGIFQVQIVQESDSMKLHSSIHIRESANASSSSPMESAPVADLNGTIDGNLNGVASDFDVFYKPEKGGVYEISVFCGNIPLNHGHPFRKEVFAGAVNVTLSGIVKFEQNVMKMVRNEIVVHLVDSYYNPVLQQQSGLQVEIASINGSEFSTEIFSDNNDGSYTASYLAKDAGAFQICASYKGQRFMPCPLGVNAYNSEYFPKAFNDRITIWEDESIAFNVLENDYLAGGNASIVENSEPGHGSLLQYGDLFRYTPYRGYYGNDSFQYTIEDGNGNRASGVVDLHILCRPPQFVSIPSNLQATEDSVSPKFGFLYSGFSGFKLAYSDLDETICVILSSKFGNVMLSPMQMQYQPPRWDELSVYKDTGVSNELKLVGCVDAINFAILSIQYFGNGNFSGIDTIKISAMNKNGRNDIDVPIYVQPINDPPVINVPPFLILDDLTDGILIFDRRDNSISIGDPDLVNFPGNRSHFRIMLSLEVSLGLVSTTVAAELIRSTEIKSKTSYQWQPLQTFVTISKHFTVKAKGIRFRGTIEESNNVLKQLSYHEGRYGDALTVTVNDLGNHGCYLDCAEMISKSLFAEATVYLLRDRPISSLAAHALGLAIIIESIGVFVLGFLLLFFICRCAFVLVREKKRQTPPQNIELSKLEDSSRHTTTERFPCTGCLGDN